MPVPSGTMASKPGFLGGARAVLVTTVRISRRKTRRLDLPSSLSLRSWAGQLPAASQRSYNRYNGVKAGTMASKPVCLGIPGWCPCCVSDDGSDFEKENKAAGPVAKKPKHTGFDAIIPAVATLTCSRSSPRSQTQ